MPTGSTRARRPATVLAVSLTLSCLAITSCANPGFGHAASVQRYLSPVISSGLPTRPGSYLGVDASYRPQSAPAARRLAAGLGERPNVLSYRSRWREPFRVSVADAALTHGATPLIWLTPARRTLAAIAAGRYQGYIGRFAAAVRAFGRPVIIGLTRPAGNAHGPRHASPATWVTAWRRIVRSFRQHHAANVTWIWPVRAHGPGLRRLRRWWPGSSYVTWVGLSGGYRRAAGTFEYDFDPAIAAVRKVTLKPILLTHFSLDPRARYAAEWRQVFRGVIRRRLLGLVWSDVAGRQSGRRLRNRALADFRRGSASIAGRLYRFR